MELTRHGDAGDFLARAGDFLSAREAEHNLILGISSRLRQQPLLYGEPAYLVTVEDEGRVVGVTMRTPPHNLILSEIDDENAIPLLLEDARDAFGALPGVVGPKAPAAEFSELWQEATGADARVEIEQRCFRAELVRPPANVAGSMRAYEPRDRDVDDGGGGRDRAQSERTANARLDRGFDTIERGGPVGAGDDCGVKATQE